MTAYPAIAAFFRKVFGGKRDAKRILILGLDAAGKTTLLYRLAGNEITTTIPTIGFNIESVDVHLSNGKSLSFMGWDVGGCDKIRPLWKHYFENVSGVVFMIDSRDHDRLVEAYEEMWLLRREFDDPSHNGIMPPFLVFANKQDLPGVLSAEDIQEKLFSQKPKLPDLIKVFPLHATGPKKVLSKSVDEAFIWFEENIWKKPVSNSTTPADTQKEPSKSTTTPRAGFDPCSPESLAEKLESWVQRSQQDCDAEEFLRQFHEYKLPAWDHYTHVRLAYIILKTYGRQKGKNMIFDGIEAYIKNSTQTTGRAFHIAMTYFWIQMVHYAIMNMEMSSGPQVVDQFTAFLIFNPHLCDGMLWSDYYEKSVIMTPEAQQGTVLPDKKPLPNVMIRETGKK